MLKKPFLLYTISENKDCNTLQKIIRFLYFHNIDFHPLSIIEGNLPSSIQEYPTIIDHDNVMYTGLSEIVQYIERKTGKNNIIEKTNEFSSPSNFLL